MSVALSMNPLADKLKERTMQFALRVARFCKTLPESWECRHVADQLFRSSTGQASNYFSSCRGRTHREFRAKLGIVLEESDETLFWLTFISRSGMSGGKELDYLLGEARELLAIFTASSRTAYTNKQ